MEYLLSIEDIYHHNLIFKLPIKNQNEEFIHFYKIIYSNTNFNLKYILLKLDYKDYELKFNNNYYLLCVNKYDPFFTKLQQLEYMILSSINKHINKTIICNCYKELIKKQYLYCFQKFPNLKNLCLKISGIWENNNSIGLVYKIYYNMSTEKLSNMIC